jgi:hypothetical protein
MSRKCQDAKTKFPNNQHVTPTCIIIPTLLEESNTIVISMDNQTSIECPDPKCPYKTHKRDHMRKRFRSRHPNDIIIITQEGLLPHCTQCGLFQKMQPQNSTKEQVSNTQKSNGKEKRNPAKRIKIRQLLH